MEDVYCNKCNLKVSIEDKYCKNCGNNLINTLPIETLKNELVLNRSSVLKKNYKKIFNVCFYTVIGIIILIIFISSFRSIADFLGTILDIFLNIWIWIFIAFIIVFRKNNKVWALVVSIVFRFITILAAVYSLISPIWVQVLK